MTGGGSVRVSAAAASSALGAASPPTDEEDAAPKKAMRPADREKAQMMAMMKNSGVDGKARLDAIASSRQNTTDDSVPAEPPKAWAPEALKQTKEEKEELAADAEIAKLKAELKALRGDGLPPADYGTTQV